MNLINIVLFIPKNPKIYQHKSIGQQMGKALLHKKINLLEYLKYVLTRRNIFNNFHRRMFSFHAIDWPQQN